MLISQDHPLPISVNGQINVAFPTNFSTQFENEADFSAAFWQNCPPPSMINAFWAMADRRENNTSRIYALGGVPGTYKTALASTFAYLTHGDKKVREENVISAQQGPDAFSHFFYTDQITGEAKIGRALKMLQDGQVVILDEAGRAKELDAAMQLFDAMGKQVSLDQGEISLHYTGGMLGGVEAQTTLDVSKANPLAFMIVTYNPNAGQSENEKARLEAIGSRFNRHQTVVNELTAADYAHMACMHLAGIPLTTMKATFGTLKPKQMLEIAQHGGRKPTSRQLGNLSRPENTAEAANMIGDFLYKTQHLLSRFQPPQKPGLREVIEVLDTIEVSDEKLALLKQDPTAGTISLRTLDKIFGIMDEQATTWALAQDRGLTRKAGEPLDAGKIAEYQNIGSFQGSLLAKAFQKFIEQSFASKPNIIQFLQTIGSQLTGVDPAGLGEGAAAARTNTLATLLDPPPPPKLSENALKLQKSLAEAIRKEGTKVGKDFADDSDDALAPVDRMAQEYAVIQELILGAVTRIEKEVGMRPLSSSTYPNRDFVRGDDEQPMLQTAFVKVDVDGKGVVASAKDKTDDQKRPFWSTVRDIATYADLIGGDMKISSEAVNSERVAWDAAKLPQLLDTKKLTEEQFLSLTYEKKEEWVAENNLAENGAVHEALEASNGKSSWQGLISKRSEHMREYGKLFTHQLYLGPYGNGAGAADGFVLNFTTTDGERATAIVNGGIGKMFIATTSKALLAELAERENVVSIHAEKQADIKTAMLKAGTTETDFAKLAAYLPSDDGKFKGPTAAIELITSLLGPSAGTRVENGNATKSKKRPVSKV